MLKRYFSTTASIWSRSGWRANQSLLRRKNNIAKQQLIQDELDSVDPVLGKEGVPFIERIKAQVVEPGSMIFGYEKQDVDKLLFGAQKALLNKSPDYNQEQILQTEARRRQIIDRILDIKNGSKTVQRSLATDLARKEFQRFDGDTGSSEVQAAIITVKIHSLADHMKQNKKDFQSIRKLRMMVQKRQSLLKYLKRSNPQKYYWAIEKLGLSNRAVMMEFNLDKRYMDKYKIFGDTKMVKESKKLQAKKKKLGKAKEAVPIKEEATTVEEQVAAEVVTEEVHIM